MYKGKIINTLSQIAEEAAPHSWVQQDCATVVTVNTHTHTHTLTHSLTHTHAHSPFTLKVVPLQCGTFKVVLDRSATSCRTVVIFKVLEQLLQHTIIMSLSGVFLKMRSQSHSHSNF